MIVELTFDRVISPQDGVDVFFVNVSQNGNSSIRTFFKRLGASSVG